MVDAYLLGKCAGTSNRMIQLHCTMPGIQLTLNQEIPEAYTDICVLVCSNS